MNSVTTRVSATTANLGPGFDCLGVALNIANRVTIRRAEGAAHPAIVSDAAKLFFDTARVAPFEFDWEILGDVPRSRGLGSSVTVRLGVLHGLNALSGAKQSFDKVPAERASASRDQHGFAIEIGPRHI